MISPGSGFLSVAVKIIQRRTICEHSITFSGIELCETLRCAPRQTGNLAKTLDEFRVSVQGLFPCGEGAGYAGGIVSAGVDGERCAEAAAQYLRAE